MTAAASGNVQSVASFSGRVVGILLWVATEGVRFHTLKEPQLGKQIFPRWPSSPWTLRELQWDAGQSLRLPAMREAAWPDLQDM